MVVKLESVVRSGSSKLNGRVRRGTVVESSRATPIPNQGGFRGCRQTNGSCFTKLEAIVRATAVDRKERKSVGKEGLDDASHRKE